MQLKEIHMRPSGRAVDQMRAVSLELDVARHAEGSCLVRFGDTHVLCTATIEERVPPFLRNTGKGWVTAEYGMLPRATNTRMRARGGARQAVRPHAGDPAPDRPLAARRHRARRPGRAPGHPRLRRAAGRRRHPHRLDHRRLRGPAPGAGEAGRRRRAAAPAAARAGGGRVAAASSAATAVLDLDYAEDSGAEADANFVLVGLGRHRRDPGDRRADAPIEPRRSSRRMRALAASGIAPAGRAAARRRSADAERGAQRLAGRHPQSGQAARVRVPARAARHRGRGRGATSGLAEPEETGHTFAANARLKARAATRRHRPAGAGRR